MKKLFAAFLAFAMLLTAAAAFAEDTVTLKIAHIGPETGAAAIYGQATSHGAAVAADEINAAGGRYRIELIDEDDTHDPEIARNAYNDALDKGAQMILGTTTTKPCIAVGTDAYEDRVFMLTPSASSPDVTTDKDNVYQVCFTDPAQGIASADYIAQHKLGATDGEATKVAIIYNNSDSYSTGIYQMFMDRAAVLGLEVVSETTFTDDTTDFSVQVADAKNNGATVVFLPIYYTPASMILQTAAATDYSPIFFGVDGMDGILTIEGFDTSLAEGVMLLTPFDPTAADEKTVKFVAAYQEKYGEVPNQFAADAYDGLYALVKAAELAGITSDMSAEEVCDPMIAAMQQITIEGLTGTMTWDSTGVVTKTPTAVIIENGVYVGYSD